MQPGEAIRTPLPDVPRHVVQPKAIGFETPRGGSSAESIFPGIGMGKFPLPNIAAMRAIRQQVLAPWIGLLLQTATSRIFPFRPRGPGCVP